MPAIDRSEITNCQLGTDATAGTLQELKNDVIGAIRYNRGRVAVRRTTGRNANKAYVRGKADSSITIPFRANDDATGSLGVAYMGTDDAVSFNLVWAKFKVSGVALIVDDDGSYETEDALVGFSVMLRESVDHDPWTWEITS